MRVTSRIGIVILLLGISLHSASAGDLGKGKYAGEFLATGGGARPLGMGGAYVALASDASSVYWNAAALSSVNYPDIILMHSSRFDGIVKYNFAAVATPVGKTAGVGLGFIRLGVDDIPFTRLTDPNRQVGEIYTDEDGKTRINKPYVDYTFSDAEYGFFISYGRASSATFSYGATAKVVHKAFDRNSAWGIGFDVAVRYQAKGGFLLAANMQDLTTTLLAWNTGKKELILPTLKVGVAYPFYATFLQGVISPVLDVDVRFEGRQEAAQVAASFSSFDFHGGLEYLFRDVLALRVGTDVGNFTAGAGIQLPRFAVDYAFMSHSELKNTHRISIRISLEEDKFRRK